MSLPKKVSERISSQIDRLILQGNQTLDLLDNKGERNVWRHVTSFQTSFLTILRMFAHIEHYQAIAEEIKSIQEPYQFVIALGHLDALKLDLEADLLTSVEEIIEAAIISDYMGQAEQLLGESISGQYDYVPAAVLAGAVLEDALRRLCHVKIHLLIL